MSGHTKGPWMHGNTEGFWVDAVCDGDGIRVAQIYGLSSNMRLDAFNPMDDRDYQALANARLIAAAPEMLAALKEACLWMSMEYAESHVALRDARAAIAKAEGK